MRIYRVREDTGEVFHPQVNQDGYYVLAYPGVNPRGLQMGANKVFVRTLEEVAARVRQGFHLWMDGQDTGFPALITPANVRIATSAGSSDKTAA